MTEQKPLALIIEDDKRQSTVFDHALRQAEFETEVIRDGEQALARLAVTIPAVVILDLHLPKVSGEDVLQQIRRSKAGRNHETKSRPGTAQTH